MSARVDLGVRVAMVVALLGVVASVGVAEAKRAPATHVVVGPGVYRPMFPVAPAEATVAVSRFKFDVEPVTNAQFLAFVRSQPRWRRDVVSGLFVDAHYLSHWGEPLALGAARPNQPVTRVSWFAAKAYCEARGQRLPTEREWEFAAAASPTSIDGNVDPTWRATVLGWYERGGGPLADVGGAANIWGVRDLHGLVWEWVYDFGAALVALDSREKSDGDTKRFCGAGAALAADSTDYATFMRLAYRSSLEASYSTRNLGFRCAADVPASKGAR